MAVCNKDCFNCPFPDCINDEMDHEDYLNSATIEKEIILPKTAKQKKLAAQKKAYYEANREKLAAQQKAYYEANREKLQEYGRAYMRRRRAAEKARA